jgi:hypothetical protein
MIMIAIGETAWWLCAANLYGREPGIGPLSSGTMTVSAADDRE